MSNRLGHWLVGMTLCWMMLGCQHTKPIETTPILETPASEDHAILGLINEINDASLIRLQQLEQLWIQQQKLTPQDDLIRVKLALIYTLPASQLKDAVKSNTQLSQISLNSRTDLQKTILQILKQINQEVGKSNDRLAQLKQSSKAVNLKSNEESKKSDLLQQKVEQLTQKNTQLQQQVKQLEQTIEALKRVEQQLIDRP